MDRREFLKRSGQVAMLGVAMQGVQSAQAQPPTDNFSVEVEYEWDTDKSIWQVKTKIKIGGTVLTPTDAGTNTPNLADRVLDNSLQIAVTKTNPTCYWVWNSYLGRWVWVCR